MPCATIIMPTFNKADYLTLTLASLTRQTQSGFELILVDDGSTDATPAVVERFANRLPIRYVRQENRGRSAARNAGLDLARTDAIVFCDDDRLVPPDFIQRHLAALDGGDNVVVVGWKKTILARWQRDRLALTAEDLQLLRARHPERSAEISRCETMQLLHEADIIADFPKCLDDWCLGDERDNFLVPDTMKDSAAHGFAIPWLYGTTANLSVRSSHLGKTIRFDERYVGWGMEDTDLSYQLHRAGATFKFETGIVNYHQIHPTGPGNAEDNMTMRWRDLANNFQHFCAKNDNWDTWMIWGTLGRLSPAGLQALARETEGFAGSLLVKELTWAYKELFRLRVQKNDPTAQ
jgi:glycosyltransferase involved in cell wall biosynthesis